MIRFTFRMPENTHVKARVLAALKNISLNDFCVEAVDEQIQRWEKKNGKLPLPPDNTK